MDPDNLQQAWQAQSSQTRVTIDVDVLLKEVQRNQQDFQTKILSRDVREIGVGLLMIPLWFFLGAMWSLPWSWYLSVPVLVWIVGFILVDRMRHKRQPCEPGGPLLQSVQASLAQVDHQIWLLRNIFWWYLLPPTISVFAFFVHVAWLDSREWWETLSSMLFVIVLYTAVYYLNQFVVRRRLEPRRQELLTLAASLNDETSNEDKSGAPATTKSAASVNRPEMLGRIIAVMVLLTAITTVASVVAYFIGRGAAGYPKVSPFAAVRWQQSQPEVKVGDEWFKLVSLNDLPAADIVAFSQKTYGNLWQKRFEEDLVELLTHMGHEPKDTVTLVVQSLASPETRTLENVPMTRANRQAIRAAAQARERDEQPPATRSSSDDAHRSLPELIPALRKEKNLVGLAAMVAVDGQEVASAVDGERKKGSGVQLEIGDRWHLGSITKSITATMIARLVESGKIEWSTTIGECFPDASIHDDWKPVTLRQLLTHTAGAPPNFSLQMRLKQPAVGPECTLARREAVLDVLAEKPTYPPGEQHAYSNVGYTIAGAMAEQTTGATWEDLVTREVFEPLKLTGAGFGPPKSSDERLEQPRGHRTVPVGKFAMGDDADNTPIMGPAGTVHMTLSDLCTYAMEHLRGDRGAGKLFSAETYKLLHTPELDQYACGWVRIEPNAGIPYTVYWHNGSNTMWYALVVFIPETNMVVAVTSNDGDVEQAEEAAWAVVWANVAASEVPQTAEYAKKSPFAAVRWHESQPEVQVDGEWFRLISLSDLPASDIVAFSQKTYGDKWQKRFEEDLVELLTRMQHPPQDAVKLVVQSLTSSETRTLENIPMTRANRQAIRDAAQARESSEPSEQPQGMRRAVPLDDADLFRSRINEFLNAAQAKAGFSGTVIVARGGNPVYEGAFGFSHLESRAPNTLDTPFRIASLSKQFTAAAIFRLAAQGKLNIDDPVHKYLPEFAKAPYRDITIHHLLTHTSGLPRIATGLMGPLRWNAMSRAATPVDDYVRLAVETPLEFEPGTDYQYSNFGYRVLAALIARMTGREYADFMEQEIFRPLGMNDTGVARVTRPPSEARIAEGLTFLKTDRTGQPLFANGEAGRNFGTGYGSGGIYTSAHDLLRWDRTLAGDEFLTEGQKQRLFQPVFDNYACGWIVKKSGLDGRLYQMHNGANDGFFSQMMRVPQDDLVIIALGNVEATPAIDEVLEQLFRLCRSLPYRDP